MKKISTIHIPQPLLFITTLVMMLYLPKVYSFQTNWYLVLIFLCLSFTVALLSVIKFIFNPKTNISPFFIRKTNYLVTSGIYQYSRNPMYLSLALLLCAIFFFLGNSLAFIGIPFFICSTTIFQIKIEETFLIQRFGDEYLRYQSKVRRWI